MRGQVLVQAPGPALARLVRGRAPALVWALVQVQAQGQEQARAPRSSCSLIDFDQGKAVQTALTDNPDNSGNLGRVVPFDYLPGCCVGTVVYIPPFAATAPSRGYRG